MKTRNIILASAIALTFVGCGGGVGTQATSLPITAFTSLLIASINFSNCHNYICNSYFIKVCQFLYVAKHVSRTIF